MQNLLAYLSFLGYADEQVLRIERFRLSLSGTFGRALNNRFGAIGKRVEDIDVLGGRPALLPPAGGASAGVAQGGSMCVLTAAQKRIVKPTVAQASAGRKSAKSGKAAEGTVGVAGNTN